MKLQKNKQTINNALDHCNKIMKIVQKTKII